MNLSSEDIKDMLVAESSLGLIFAKNLFIGREPGQPKDCVTLFDYTAHPPQLTFDNAQYEYPSLQIRVRSTNYVKGGQLIEKIKESLHGRAQETWNGTLYSVIRCSSGPALLEWDENGMVKFVVNFNINRRTV